MFDFSIKIINIRPAVQESWQHPHKGVCTVSFKIKLKLLCFLRKMVAKSKFYMHFTTTSRFRLALHRENDKSPRHFQLKYSIKVSKLNFTLHQVFLGSTRFFKKKTKRSFLELCKPLDSRFRNICLSDFAEFGSRFSYLIWQWKTHQNSG